MAPPSSILVVDGNADRRQSLRLSLEAGGARVVGVATAGAGFEALERGRFDAVLLDLWCGGALAIDVLRDIRRRQPRLAILVVAENATCTAAVVAMKHGADDFLPTPCEPETVRNATTSAIEEKGANPPEADPGPEQGDLAPLLHSASPACQKVLAAAERAAASDCVVLLRGESGTGKTMLAAWIHARSPRGSRGPFVTVNCPALSPELMSSTLFGYRRGAFTGAVTDTTGKVQEAEGGTLFLDEIGDLGPDPQARILRFLNDQAFERVGESRERRANVRLIAATNRPLEQEVASGRFREDLLYRLNVVTLTLPPLRERRADIPPLAAQYLAHAARAARRGALAFSPEAERTIQSHTWPGNLRELRNTVERAAVLAQGDVIEVEDLGLDAVTEGADERSRGAVELGGDVRLDALEREHIARVLAWAPTLDDAARILGIGVATLTRKRRFYGLS